MRRSRRRAIVALAAVALGPAFAQEVQVLVLKYRRAEDVIPILLPYLDPAGKLTGHGDQLQVRTTPQNLVQIRQLLLKLDLPPRWLTIAVRQDRPPVHATETRVPSGPVVTDSRSAAAPASNDGARVTRAQSSQQKIRVLEDTRTAIQFDAPVPMTFRRFVFGRQGVNEVLGTVTYDALVQFLVRPRLAGTVVTLEIEPQEGTFLTETGERGRLSTTVRGRLGDWIPVGGADLRAEDSALERDDGALRAQTRTATDQRGVWLNVELEEPGVR